jgi:hypothetical protein
LDYFPYEGTDWLLIKEKDRITKFDNWVFIGMKILILKIQAIILTIGVGIYEYYKGGNKPF